MKRLFTLLALFSITLGSYAYDVYVDGIYYNVVSKTKEAEVTFKDEDYKSYSGTVTIPETFVSNETEYRVIKIGANAFRSSSISSISLPNSIISIGKYAFAGCSFLSSIILPNSITSVGEHAFDKCI